MTNKHIDGVDSKMNAEEQAIYDANEATWAAGAVERQWNEVRETRKPLLATADVEINKLIDAGASTALWSAYRQALRDITLQADPFNVAWPTPPS